MIKVSLIVPVYNTEKYLEKCLQSLVNQTLKEIEVIVVNDGSTDNSIVIAERFEKEYPKIVKILSKTNGGLGSARNFGLKHAKGKYIMFVDSDDSIENNAVEELYKIIEKEDLDIVLCDYYYDYETHKTPVTTSIKEGKITRKEYLMLPVAAWNKIYKREFLLKIKYNYPDRLWYEDLATNPQLSLYTDKIYYLKKPLYNYLQRTESIMNKTKYNDKMQNIFDVMDILTNDFKRENGLEKFKEEIEYMYISRLLHDASLRFFKFSNYLENIKRINKIIRENYPKWRKNKYYRKENIKYKIVCNLIYCEKFKLLKLVLKNK